MHPAMMSPREMSGVKTASKGFPLKLLCAVTQAFQTSRHPQTRSIVDSRPQGNGLLVLGHGIASKCLYGEHIIGRVFRNLTRRTRRKPTESTEGLAVMARN